MFPSQEPGYTKNWRQRNPHKTSLYGRVKTLKKYGLTIGTWSKLFNRQDCRCACCGSDIPHSKRGWHTDHDHRTGHVRGILCSPCNLAVGYYESDRRNLVETYLRKFT